MTAGRSGELGLQLMNVRELRRDQEEPRIDLRHEDFVCAARFGAKHLRPLKTIVMFNKPTLTPQVHYIGY